MGFRAESQKGTVYLYKKQDIGIYVTESRPNGWTDWADIFCGLFSKSKV